MPNWIGKSRLSEPLRGVFSNLGSPLALKMAAQLGFDWTLIDLEHGAATEATLAEHISATAGTTCSPIVRVVSNNQDHIKRSLDLGAAGVMVPYVSSAAEAEKAVAFTRYPPRGVRGVAGSTVATGFGLQMDPYHRDAENETLVVVQIETEQAVENAEQIAATDGVDVLFVGPLDLSYNLGCPKDFNHPKQVAALQRVVAACDQHGKTPGILASVENATSLFERGFRFVAVSSDAGSLRSGLQQALEA